MKVDFLDEATAGVSNQQDPLYVVDTPARFDSMISSNHTDALGQNFDAYKNMTRMNDVS